MKNDRNSFGSSFFGFELKNLKRKNAAWLLALSAFFFISVSNDRAQQNGFSANDFTSVEYFDAPHQRQKKSELSGAAAQPLAGGLLVIKNLKLEMFDVDGKTNFIVEAPECVYDTIHQTADSSGHLQLRTGDGKFHVEGDGFFWRQTDQFLMISNNVRTVIESAFSPEK
jgi:hypothetical protein